MSAAETCKFQVWKRDRSFRGGHSKPCPRAAKADGFCAQHHPDAFKKRAEKSRRRGNAKWDAESRRRQVEQAAPELLAALKALVDQSERPPSWSLDSDIANARAAIAKAEGKS